MRRIPLRGLTFDVRVEGPDEGEPVLLLHGFPQHGGVWRRVNDRLHRAGLRTVAPDQRGYSPGARPDDIAAYRMSELAADAAGLLDELGIQAAHVVGHDLGAVVGWHLAGRHPGRVRTLTAVSAPHPLASVAALANDPDQRQRSAYLRLFRQHSHPERVLLTDEGRRLRGIFADSGLTRSEVDEYLHGLLEAPALRAALNWYRALSRHDAEGLGEIRCPTTHVWSDGDIALGRYGAEHCGDYVAGPYRFVELTGVSHWIPDEAPESLAAAITDRVGSLAQ